MKSVWIARQGRWYDDVLSIVGVYATEDAATSSATQEGYTLDHEQQLWINMTERTYRKISSHSVQGVAAPTCPKCEAKLSNGINTNLWRCTACAWEQTDAVQRPAMP